MKQYQNLLRDILENGQVRKSAREGMPSTIEVFNRTMTFDLNDGFPILTTKKVSIKNIATELLWFLKGDTNVKYLNEHGCKIWNADAYKLYCRQQAPLEPCSFEEWLDNVMEENSYMGNDGIHYYGDCGNIYGHQWRAFQGYSDNGEGYDQIVALIDSLREQPYSRYHIVSAWHPFDFFESGNACLPACHMMFQCYVNNDYKLDIMMLQRSCDTFLGVPYNITSYALLDLLLARECGLFPGKLIWTGNCVHLYENHIDQAKELLTREPYKLPSIAINSRKSMLDLEPEDIELINYQCHPAIKAPLSVGK